MTKENLAQIYATYVETITASEGRRQQYSSMLYAITLGAGAIIGSDVEIDTLFVTTPLAILSWIWCAKIDFLKRLARSKFHVVKAMESRMDFSPFMMEWEHFKKQHKVQLPFGLADLDLTVPLLIGASATVFSVLEGLSRVCSQASA